MNSRRNLADPEALVIAREMQERLHPAEIILLGSRAAGDHRPDSDVDLMAVLPDEAGVKEADEILRRLLEGKYDVPVVNVVTFTRKEFRRTAPVAQSMAGQAARHGVSPDGRSLNYRPEREPEPEEVRKAAVFWLALAQRHLEVFTRLPENARLTRPRLLAFDAQQALERAFKGLLTASNDGARFRRDAALMWRHVKNTRPIGDPEGARAMEALLSATAAQDGERCLLTEFSEAFRRGDAMPDLGGPEWNAVGRHLVPAVNALIAEALARSGATRKDLQQERLRRREPGQRLLP